MRIDYPLMYQDSAAVDRYENVVYAPGSHASAISERQRVFLRRVIATGYTAPPVHHDFGCGTGRALRMVQDLVSAAHGYDVAPAMLDAARDLGVRAVLHRVSADDPAPRPAATAGPAVVTLFRLLLNATPPVRNRALSFAARALPTPDAGLLVLENHGRRRSLRHLHAWRHPRDPRFAELSDRDVASLLARHGFRIVGRCGFALTTRGCHRYRPLRVVARRVDDLLAARLTGLATDVLYVARRDGAP